MFTRITLQRKRWFWTVILVTVAVLFMSACTAGVQQAVPKSVAPASEDAPVVTESTAPTDATETMLPAITITARDFAFDMPDKIPSGWVSLTLTNAGKVNHHGIVMRLREGVSVEDALAAMDDPKANEDEYSDLRFFLPDTDPGASNQATVEMAPGHWMIFSVSMDAVSIGATDELTPDYALGSIKEFDVTATETPADAPDADMTLTIGADDFDLPEEIAAGSHTIQIVNKSDQENGYAFILKMEGDTTIDDVLAMFDALFSGQEMDVDTMPVFHAVGGLMGCNLGDRYYTTVDLTPGNYTMISSISGSEFPYSGFNKSFTVPGTETTRTSP